MTHHIFREVKPDVYANNRVSSVLDTGHSVEEILKECVAEQSILYMSHATLTSPLSKHKGPAAGIAALVGHW